MATGIVDLVVEYVQEKLEEALITNLASGDPQRAGVVKIGPLQGDPEPDTARISVEVHHNDPDSLDGPWRDRIEIVEIGGVVTWSRRFTVKIRCLLDRTREVLDEAREIASGVRDKAELVLLKELFVGVATADEYVARGAMARTLQSDMVQGGGPPKDYDFHIKIYFEVWTTRTGVYS